MASGRGPVRGLESASRVIKLVNLLIRRVAAVVGRTVTALSVRS